MDYKDKWKKYGEMTGMTRFSDIGKKNWEDINWEAKFKDRPGAWNAVADQWHTMDAQDKWSAYSQMKGEVPDDWDDVHGSTSENELAADIKELDGKMPDFKDHDFGGVQYSKWDPNKDDHQIFEPDGKRGGTKLKAKYSPTPIKTLEESINAASGKRPDDIEKEVLTVQQQAASASMDKAGTGEWQAPVTAPGGPDKSPPELNPDPEQWNTRPKDAPMDDTFSTKPEFLSKNVTSDVGTKPPRLSWGSKNVQDAASDAYDNYQTSPDPKIGTGDPREPDVKPQDDATAWQGVAGKAKREGLETDYSAYDPGRTATSGQITSAMGSKLARSKASRSGLNTMGTGSFKYRNPLSINN